MNRNLEGVLLYHVMHYALSVWCAPSLCKDQYLLLHPYLLLHQYALSNTSLYRHQMEWQLLKLKLYLVFSAGTQQSLFDSHFFYNKLIFTNILIEYLAVSRLDWNKFLFQVHFNIICIHLKRNHVKINSFSVKIVIPKIIWGSFNFKHEYIL